MQKNRNQERRNSARDEGQGLRQRLGLSWFQHTHTLLLCCCRMVETLADSFCFFAALCWTSGGLSAVLRRAFLAAWPGDGDPSVVRLLLRVRLPSVLLVGPDWVGSSMLLCGPSGARVNGSGRFMWYRLLLPDRPSRRSREGTSSQVSRVSSSGGCCGPTGSKKNSQGFINTFHKFRQDVCEICQGKTKPILVLSHFFVIISLTWRRGVSARDKKVESHCDTLDKSSSTASSCRLSWIVPGSCRAMTIALVLSARSILWRHRSRAWLTSWRAFDTPHGACRVKLDNTNQNQELTSLGKRAYLTIASSLFWHMEMASWGGTMFHRPSLPRMM